MTYLYLNATAEDLVPVIQHQCNGRRYYAGAMKFWHNHLPYQDHFSALLKKKKVQTRDTLMYILSIFVRIIVISVCNYLFYYY